MFDPLKRVASIDDLRLRAQKKLPRSVFGFLDGGATDECTLQANRSAFSRYQFVPKVAKDVSQIDLSTDILGARASMPVALSPIGFAGMFYPNGEVLAAKVAKQHNIPFCLSTNSVKPLEAITDAVPQGNNWFQLYFLKDRDWMNSLVERAKNSGYSTLCVTLDLPVAGRRERDIRNGFSVPLRPTLTELLDLLCHLPWLVRAASDPVRFGNFDGNPHADGFVSIAQHVANMFDPTVTWDDVKKIRDDWPGKLVIKGILHPEDAEQAVKIGAEAISISNHGGRQLDGSISALQALEQIAPAVSGQIELLLDGGVRRGTDIIKALHLGATAVLIGRPYIYGLAAAGEQGVEKVLELLQQEMKNAFALLGVQTCRELAGIDLRKSP